MGPQNESDFVIFQEELNAIWAELHNVACPVGVSDKVGLNAELLVAISGVGPQNVDHKLLLEGRNLVDDF